MFCPLLPHHSRCLREYLICSGCQHGHSAQPCCSTHKPSALCQTHTTDMKITLIHLVLNPVQNYVKLLLCIQALINNRSVCVGADNVNIVPSFLSIHVKLWSMNHNYNTTRKTACLQCCRILYTRKMMGRLQCKMCRGWLNDDCAGKLHKHLDKPPSNVRTISESKRYFNYKWFKRCA